MPLPGFTVTLNGRFRVRRTLELQADHPEEAAHLALDHCGGLEQSATEGAVWHARFGRASGRMDDVQLDPDAQTVESAPGWWQVPLLGWMQTSADVDVRAADAAAASRRARALARQHSPRVRWTGSNSRPLGTPPDELLAEVDVYLRDEQDPFAVLQQLSFTLTHGTNGEALPAHDWIQVHLHLKRSGVTTFIGRPGQTPDLASSELSLATTGALFLEVYDQQYGLDSGPGQTLELDLQPPDADEPPAGVTV